jgi:hypothetical protein
MKNIYKYTISASARGGHWQATGKTIMIHWQVTPELEGRSQRPGRRGVRAAAAAAGAGLRLPT